MSYLRKMEYEIRPNKSFPVIRGCGKCGEKTVFENTGCFRVNANKSKLDVWLIYQCTKCRHTYNLTIFERVNPCKINKDEYEKFLRNDDELSFEYGTNVKLFQKNKAVIDWKNIEYMIVPDTDNKINSCEKNDVDISIHNAFQLKIPVEKIVCNILGLSRSKLKKGMEEGRFAIQRDQEKGDIEVKCKA